MLPTGPHRHVQQHSRCWCLCLSGHDASKKPHRALLPRLAASVPIGHSFRRPRGASSVQRPAGCSWSTTSQPTRHVTPTTTPSNAVARALIAAYSFSTAPHHPPVLPHVHTRINTSPQHRRRRRRHRHGARHLLPQQDRVDEAGDHTGTGQAATTGSPAK